MVHARLILTGSGDGLPSMASIDVGDDELSLRSESSDLQRARKMYADLQAMSMESGAGSQEVIIVIVVVVVVILVCRRCLILMPMLGSSIMRSEHSPWKQVGALRTSWIILEPAQRA